MVMNRAKLLVGNKKSDDFVRDALNDVLTKSKKSEKGTFPAQAKASLDLTALKKKPGKMNAKLRIVDTDGVSIPHDDLAGRSWSRILISVKSVYIQSTGTYGLSKSLAFVEVSKTKSAGGVHFSSAVAITDFKLGKNANIGLIPIKSDSRTVIDIMSEEGSKAVISFTKGGRLPPFVISANKFNATNFTFTIEDLEEADAMRLLNVDFKAHIVAHRSTLLPKFTISDTSLMESCYDIISEGKQKDDGSCYLPSSKASFILPPGYNLDGTLEEDMGAAEDTLHDTTKKKGPPTPVTDVSGRAVRCDELAGRRWVHIEVLLACVYLQNKSIGISRRILKVVVEDDDDDELEPRDVVPSSEEPNSKRHKA
jgi:hypothetical protein